MYFWLHQHLVNYLGQILETYTPYSAMNFIPTRLQFVIQGVSSGMLPSVPATLPQSQPKVIIRRLVLFACYSLSGLSTP